MQRSIAFVLAIGLSLVPSYAPVFGDVGAEEGRRTYYIGAATPGNDGIPCSFFVEIEKVTFLLTDLANKYKVLRIRVENRSPTSLQLSSDNDTFDFVTGKQGNVRAVLNLQKADPELWDSLDIVMREALVYPKIIKGAKNSSIGRAEVSYFFAFFPKERIKLLPLRFEYTIASLGQRVVIETRPRKHR